MTDDPAARPPRPATGTRVTSFDVARLAGVSRAAVSRAFTPGAHIAPQTREKVFEAARTLGYRVNYLARGLTNQRSDLVGVVAADLDNPFRAQQIEKISEALIAENFRPILLVSRGNDTERLIELLLHYAVAGVIVTSDAPPSALCEECAVAGVPIVLINKGGDLARVDRVISDHETAARQAAELLAGTGRLAVMGMFERSFTALCRRDAFLAHSARFGAAPMVITLSRNDYASGHAAAAVLMDSRIDGVFCINDYMACGVIDALREAGRSVPADLRVIGHDDIPQARWSAYALTTFTQAADVQARQAIDFLSSRSRDGNLEARLARSPVTLVRRLSL